MTYEEFLATLSPYERMLHQSAVQTGHSALPDTGLMGGIADWIEARPEREFAFGGLGDYARATEQGQPTSYLQNLIAGMDMMIPGVDDALIKGAAVPLGGPLGHMLFGTVRRNGEPMQGLLGNMPDPDPMLDVQRPIMSQDAAQGLLDEVPGLDQQATDFLTGLANPAPVPIPAIDQSTRARVLELDAMLRSPNLRDRETAEAAIVDEFGGMGSFSSMFSGL